MTKAQTPPLTTEMVASLCEPAKVIICTVPQGMGADIVVKLYEQSEVINVQHSTARAQYAEDEKDDWQEVDTLQVFVKESLADEVFELMYHLTQLHGEDGRYLYQMHLPAVTPFKLPFTRDITSGDIPVEAVVGE
jgi:hypothetical protein